MGPLARIARLDRIPEEALVLDGDAPPEVRAALEVAALRTLGIPNPFDD